MRSFRRFLLAGAVILAGYGCSAVNILRDDRHVRGFNYTPVKASETKLANEKFLYRYRTEWQFNRRHQDRPPGLCVAMSGGGMRSASYNIGVLQGLYRIGVLDEVDILSSVSGGGYALSWYYLQQYYTRHDSRTCDEQLFDSHGRFQRYLENRGNTFLDTWVGDKSDTAYTLTKKLVLWASALPVNIFANELFDWHANLNPIRRGYENGIERVFHLTPADNGTDTVNDAGIFSFTTVDPGKKAGFPELRAFILERRLPYFIINTTAVIDDDTEHYNAQLSKSIYEFTPLYHGSDGFFEDYRPEFPFPVSRAVSISGAAVDASTMPGPLQRVMFSRLNLDLGYKMDNPVASPDKAWKHGLLPFPFYLMHSDIRDRDGSVIYLSDGGHAENLGAFSLVKRLCDTIIIVDAEHDPEYKFGAYEHLRRQLRAEMNVDFELKDYERFKDYKGSRPILDGRIGMFPVRTLDGRDKDLEIKVKYIKLSLDEERVNSGKYPDTVLNYYQRNAEHVKGWLLTYYAFPQQPTSDLSFGKAQFSAYRDLGYETVMCNLRKEDVTE